MNFRNLLRICVKLARGIELKFLHIYGGTQQLKRNETSHKGWYRSDIMLKLWGFR